MQVIAYDTRPTKAKFYGNDSFNPTKIYLSEMYQGVENGYVELENRFVFKGKFLIQYVSFYKGLSLQLKDTDFPASNDNSIHITELAISNILTGVLSGDVIIEDNAYVINFRVNKSGTKYTMEILTRAEVNEILDTSPFL